MWELSAWRLGLDIPLRRGEIGAAIVLPIRTLDDVRARIAVAVLSLVLLTGCGGGTPEQASPPTRTAPPTDTKAAAAPRIEGVTLDGERLSLADFRGRPVFVNVWSSW
jgi:hypothetical protein